MIPVSVLAVALVGPFAAGRAAPRTVAQEVAPAAVPPLVAELAAAWNAHDPQRVAALHTADAVVELGYSGEVIARGRDQIAEEFVGGVLATYPDVRFETRGGYVSDDLIVWRWTFIAHYTGQEPGLPPGTGQPVEFGGVSLYELRDGLISRKVFYTDDLTFMEQLGLLCPESEEAAPAA